MKILLKVFYKSLCEGLVEILKKCCQRLLHDLVEVLVRSSGRGPGEIKLVSLHDLAQVLVRSFSGDRIIEILLKRRPCSKMLTTLCVSACMRVLLRCP